MEMGQLWKLIVALGLVALNGILVLGEFALVKVRESRLEQLVNDGVERAEAALRVMREVDKSLSVAQLGTVLTALGLGWLAAPEIARLLRGLFPEGVALTTATWAAGALALLLSAAIYVVFGQLIPKSLAARYPESGRGLAAAPVSLIYGLLSPLIWSINGLGHGVLRLFGLRNSDGDELAHSEEDLKILMLKSHRQGLLGATQRDLLTSIFDFTERTVQDVMTRRQDLACVSSSMKVAEALEAVRQFGFTRYPVCDGDKDRVVGVVHFRELMDSADAAPKTSVTDLMAPPLALPHDTPVSEALKKMQGRKTHMAVVADEYGGTAGIVTLEDILADLVGEMPDESPPASESDKIRSIGPGIYELDGSLIVEDVEDALDVDLHHAGVETIGNYIFGRLGRKPQIGDTVKVSGVVFDVIEVKGTRIRRVRAQRAKEAAPFPERQDRNA